MDPEELAAETQRILRGEHHPMSPAALSMTWNDQQVPPVSTAQLLNVLTDEKGHLQMLPGATG